MPSGPTATAGRKAGHYRQPNARPNRDFSTIRAQSDAQCRKLRSADARGFLPRSIRPEGHALTGRRSRRDVAAGRPICRSAPDTQVDYQYQRTRSTVVRSAEPEFVRRGGLRYGRSSPTSISRHLRDRAVQAAVGRGRRRISAREFQDSPGELQSYAIGPFFRPSVATTAANCPRSRVSIMARPASAASPVAPPPRVRRDSRVFPTPAAPTKAGTVMPPMPNSTSTRLRD